ncbi:hypothetical protein HYPSUDRAFT_38654 [Hypholoma sublateritium FD-334 SS-4]|uniref:Uncharacterized protein n=1 Tax=Hypholoma sublateritium (strain FD-334 SS-4) TaxID=945553 RepID=A0A0D2LBH8_HYPSF|nr:hypothetical protein HYPSUDRAFT_38654 [Hypholoma sublateritium FD-334 SS-4]
MIFELKTKQRIDRTMPKPITRMVLVLDPPVGMLSMSIFNVTLLLVDRKEIKTKVAVFVRTETQWDSSLICYI